MKGPTQSTLAEAQRWVDQRVATVRESLTKKGDAKSTPKTIAWAGSVIYKRPEVITNLFDDLETRKVKLDKFTHDLLCELAALALERGELPPKPLCEYVAELLRRSIKTTQRGSLMFRNGDIAWMLVELEKRGIPLFPNRAGRRPGQTYGCDMVVKAFKKAGIGISSATVERAWSHWSRVLVRT